MKVQIPELDWLGGYRSRQSKLKIPTKGSEKKIWNMIEIVLYLCNKIKTL